MSAFDPNSFLATTTDTANSTTYVPVPEGIYQAVVISVAARNPKGNALLDIQWRIDDDSVAAETGLSNPTCRQSIFLDVTDSGGLDNGKGKNIQLGRLREALNQNVEGQAWAPSMLEGQVAMVNVQHRMYEGNTYADVKGVSAI